MVPATWELGFLMATSLKKFSQTERQAALNSERFADVIEQSTGQIVRAYLELTRLMLGCECSLEELQGATEFLLDAIRGPKQNIVSKARFSG
jgi:hypothetical protein